jgi:hypothetical protein
MHDQELQRPAQYDQDNGPPDDLTSSRGSCPICKPGSGQ